MKLISIVASRPIEKKIASELIMDELGTDYSHVSWIFWNTARTKPRYYEAVLHGGVVFTGQRHWEGRNKVVFRKDFEVSESTYDQFLDEAMDKCGEQYGFWQNIGIKIKSVFALSGNLFSSSKDSSNCSELIYIFSKFVNLKVETENDQDLVTPKHIVEACRGAI
jgi:hypothetical protein